MPLLQVDKLSVSFVTRHGVNQAVDNVSFSVESGGITAIIGESGSGKSVACYSLLGLVPTPPGRVDSGSAMFQGQDLLQLSPEELRKIRGRDIAMVFQDPMTCLNPFMTIGAQLMEPLRYHKKVSRYDARNRAMAALEEVGIRDPHSTFSNFPHQFSGGMRQRVMIAMALINEPKLLIADEPTTALDVTIQAQILALLADLQRSREIGIVFISHDLAVVADIADQVVVMQQGQVVESDSSHQIFHAPKHPYTRKLLDAIPRGAPGNSGQSQGAVKEEVANDAPQQPLLQVKDLHTWFQQKRTEPVKAVNGVSFDLHRGTTLGLVGESGSGKSTIGRSILRLQAITSGSILFDGNEISSLTPKALKPLRTRMQIIFQDPYASLNPRMTVQETLAEPLLLHGIENRRSVGPAVSILMDRVGLARKLARKYPHEFSGGQRQRIAIGRALATRPEFVVADEPVSALDVTIQAQILDLLIQLGREYQFTMLFITHDLAVVRQIADQIIVLKSGRIVEQGITERILTTPEMDYTKELLNSVPGHALARERH
jgi:oligopeptide transport system ATP-binding protein